MNILVESVAGILAAQKLRGDDKGLWHTSSPLAFEHLAHRGESVRWLDELIPTGTADAIGYAAFEVVRQLGSDLERAALCAGIQGVKHFIAMPLQRLVAVLAYKEMVLESWLRLTPGPHVVVGDPLLTPVKRSDISVDRFDTLFAVLAETRGLEIIFAPVDGRDELRREIDKVTLHDRVLSLLDLSSSQAVFRILKYVLDSGRVVGRRSGPLVRILSDNELIREILPSILVRGCAVRLEPPLAIEEATPANVVFGLPDEHAIAHAWQRASAMHGIKGGSDDVHRIVAQRLAESSRHWLSAQMAAKRRVKDWLRERRPQVLLSNTVSGVATVSLVLEASRVNIPLVVAEHGVSAGLSRYHEPVRPYSEVALAHRYLTTNPNSTNFFDEDRTLNGKSVTVGMPNQVRSIPLRPLQGSMTRRKLGARKEDRVVIYLASAIQNNLRFLPFSPSDRDVYLLEKAMAVRLLPKVRGIPVIKLYNTRREVDADPLTSEQFRPPTRVRVLQAGDFRYLRAGADIIILQSPMSTLGWAFGSGKPIFFLEVAGRPLRADVRDALRDSVFWHDTTATGWEENFLDQINRPDREILAAWEGKRLARESFLIQYIFGPEDASRRCAEAILTIFESHAIAA